jgi:hypothetical protein
LVQVYQDLRRKMNVSMPDKRLSTSNSEKFVMPRMIEIDLHARNCGDGKLAMPKMFLIEVPITIE